MAMRWSDLDSFVNLIQSQCEPQGKESQRDSATRPRVARDEHAEVPGKALILAVLQNNPPDVSSYNCVENPPCRATAYDLRNSQRMRVNNKLRIRQVTTGK